MEGLSFVLPRCEYTHTVRSDRSAPTSKSRRLGGPAVDATLMRVIAEIPLPRARRVCTVAQLVVGRRGEGHGDGEWRGL